MIHDADNNLSSEHFDQLQVLNKGAQNLKYLNRDEQNEAIFFDLIDIMEYLPQLDLLSIESYRLELREFLLLLVYIKSKFKVLNVEG